MGRYPGFFISFEGLDGAGKSTQIASLAAALRVKRYDVLPVRPTSTLLGEMLHGVMLQHQRGDALEPWTEALLFTAERVQLLRELVLPALERGTVVLSDRFFDSTLAYQGGGRGLPEDQLLRLHDSACGGIWPDLTIYLDVPPTVAAQRQRAQQLPLDRIEGAPEEFHRRVRHAFDTLAESNPQRIVRFDATRPALDVARDIERTVLERLPRVSGIPAARATARA